MKAQMHGDVSESDKMVAQDLENLEIWVFSETTERNIPPEDRAQILVCMAHHWMIIGMDDECERLLRDASRICSKYYSKVIHHQVRQDYDFALIVYNLRGMLAASVLAAVGLK